VSTRTFFGVPGALARDHSVAALTRATRAHVLEVDEAGQVPVLHAVLDPHVLVLVREVLVRLGEPGGRVAALQEGDLVTTTEEPVPAVDHPDPHAGRPVVRHLGHQARQLTCR
jgi:hypothetical protein